MADWTPIIVAVIAGSVALLGQRGGRSNIRDQIKTDIEIYDSLPDNSLARGKLLGAIDARIESLVTTESAATRDWSGVTIALILLGIGSWTTYVVVNAGGNWNWFLVGTILFLVFGVFGFFESIAKTARDVKGHRIGTTSAVDAGASATPPAT